MSLIGMSRLIAGTCVALCAVVLQTGCGDGEARAAPSASAHIDKSPGPNHVRALAATSQVDTADSSAASDGGVDEPRVEDVILISSKRVDRTRFDYSFKLLVRGAFHSYESGSFNVSKLPSGSSSMVGAVTFGQIDALRRMLSAGTITIRHDRTYPFVKGDLKFLFAGKVAAPDTTPGTPRIGAVRYYLFGGRPGHEGFFEGTASNPNAGPGTQLRVLLSAEATAASYTFKSLSGAVLASGVVSKLWPNNDEASAMVDIPAEPFTTTISAAGANGANATRTSSPIYPRTFPVDLVIENGAFRFGEIIRGRLNIGKASKADRLVVEITLPDGFSTPQTRFDIPVGPTAEASIAIPIQSPAVGKSTRFHTISALHYLASSPESATTAVLNVFSR